MDGVEHVSTDYNLEQVTERIFREITLATPAPLKPTPFEHKGYIYNTISKPGLRLPIVERERFMSGRAGKSEKVLDLNQFNEPFVELVGLRISPDNTEVAFTLKLSPDADLNLYRKQITNSNFELIAERVFDFEYNQTNNIYYTSLNSHERPSSLFRYDHKTNYSEKLYEERNNKHHLNLSSSKDYLTTFLYSDSLEKKYIYILQNEKVVPLNTDGENLKVGANNQTLYQLDTTNIEHPLKIANKNTPTILWKTAQLQLSNTPTDIEPFDNFIVVTTIHGTCEVLIFFDPTFNELARSECLSPFQHIRKRINRNPNAQKYLFEISTVIEPPILYEFDLKTKTIKTIIKSTVLKYRKQNYQTYQINATTRDSESLPITVTHLKNQVQNQDSTNNPSPTVILAYGSYGINPPGYFDPALIPFLDRDITVAICHVRGGGEMGTRWRQLGMKNGKLDAVSDLRTCIDTMIERKISEPKKIAALGISAGGTLVSSLMNSDPSIFKAVVLRAPFLKVTETLSSEEIPLSVRDRSEWGDPKDPQIATYLKSYDPYLTIKQKSYPNMLIISNERDTLVPLKDTNSWIQKFKSINSDAKITHHVLANYDHHGPITTIEQRKLRALEGAFLISALN